jgi:hypothetical protein
MLAEAFAQRHPIHSCTSPQAATSTAKTKEHHDRQPRRRGGRRPSTAEAHPRAPTVAAWSGASGGERSRDAAPPATHGKPRHRPPGPPTGNHASAAVAVDAAAPRTLQPRGAALARHRMSCPQDISPLHGDPPLGLESPRRRPSGPATEGLANRRKGDTATGR